MGMLTVPTSGYWTITSSPNVEIPPLFTVGQPLGFILNCTYSVV
jgi:hypothetical protein